LENIFLRARKNRREDTVFFRIFAVDMETNAISLLEGLNSAQKSAVQCTEGPVLIVAGAGSGKTKVLTSRTAYILAKGCEPERILALTFTKKAAGEMKERIGLMVGPARARHVVMGTFHSVFIRFLRDYAAVIGYPESFTIYDQSDSQSAVKAVVKELGLDEKTYKPREVLSRISAAKNNLCSPAQYAANAKALESDRHAKRPEICRIYDAYWKKCRMNGVMDFDDILFNLFLLLKDNPEARVEISSRFDYIMIDEYQDTNSAQYQIMRLLTQRNHNICVVGDDSQSIYAFRGARIENILNFRKDYPESRIFRLEQNYRSTRTIVDAANTLIEKNSGRIPKNCFSEGENGEKIRIIKAFGDKEEALLVVSSISDRIQSAHARYEDFAILYRTNSQSRALEEVLRRRNIPYVIYSGNAFFDRAEVKDIMACLKFAVNLNDDESFKRIVSNHAKGIGETSLKALAAAAAANNVSLFVAMCREDLENYGLKPAAIARIRSYFKPFFGFYQSVATTDAYELALKIVNETGVYADFKQDNSIEGMSRTENVEELLNSVKAFVEERHNDDFEEIQMTAEGEVEYRESELPVVTLGAFLENISLLAAIDMGSEEDSTNKVALMTVHSSKGLEFPYVYITGMEENLFPSCGDFAASSELEEERRLFYVAVTRAKVAVTLSYAQSRMKNGETKNNPPSRFLKEIDSKYLLNPVGEEDSAAGGDFPAFWRRGGSGSADRPSYPSSDRPGTPGYGGRSDSRQSYGRPSERRAPAAPASSGFSRPAPPEAPRPIKSVPPRVPDSDFIPSPISDLRAGQRVEHNRFGKGTIEKLWKDGSEMKATIKFDEYGIKMLIVRFAKIRIVSKE